MNEQNYNMRYSWFVAIIIALVSLAQGVLLMKAMPTLPLLMEYFNVNEAEASIFIAIFSLAGLILAFPSGILLKKFGPKMLVVLGMLLFTIGGIIGSVSTTVALLTFSRFIEGIGYAVLAVGGPIVLAAFFPPDKIGKPMGIYITAFVTAEIVIFNLAPVLGEWKTVWWVMVAFSAVVLLLTLFIKMPPKSEESVDEVKPKISDALKIKSLWFVAIGYLLLLSTVTFIQSFSVTFFTTILGMTAAKAGLIYSIGTILGILGAPLYGAIIDKTGKRKSILLIATALMGLTLPLIFFAKGGYLIAVQVLVGLIGAGPAVIVYIIAPEIVKKPELGGIAMSVVVIAENIGIIVGASLFGFFITFQGWSFAALMVIPVIILSVISLSLVKTKDRQKSI